MKTSPRLQIVSGAPSWQFASDSVEASITQRGGHLAPILFRSSGGVVQPMSIAPWALEKMDPKAPPLLNHLRGDFFCLPFGADPGASGGPYSLVHGDTANQRWGGAILQSTAAGVRFTAQMRTRVAPGLVTKTISLRHGETNVYCRHFLEGFSIPLCLGHHAMLAFGHGRGPARVSVSPWYEGRVRPVPFEAPEKGGYSALKTGAAFGSLQRVPLAEGGVADLTSYPAREGFEDLVMISSRATSRLAWTAVCFQQAGYVWFGLKDPRTLASTVLWHSNGGRHYRPWNGRHRGVLGLEEVTAYFDLGQSASVASNPLSRKGVATCLALDPETPLAVNYVMAVASIPRDFDRVRTVVRSAGGVTLTAHSGSKIFHRVELAHFSVRSIEVV